MLGVGIDPEDPSLSLADREKRLSEATKDQLKGTRAFQECANSLEKAIAEELTRKRE